MAIDTFTDPTKFEPKVDPTKGGTSLGNSYLNAFVNCPRKWFNIYARPIETLKHTGQGIEEMQTALPLLTGTLFHEGLDAWYRSGWVNGKDTGDYNFKAAITRMREQWETQKHRYHDDATALADYERVHLMLSNYHKSYGPGGTSQDWPNIRIASDADGNPMVEQDFRYELIPGYWYTGRLDAICIHNGSVRVLEHKTTSVYGVRNRMNSLSFDSQFSGEMWLAQQAMPSVKVEGVLVNVVIKDRKDNSKYEVAVRECTTRTEKQLEVWKLNACNVLYSIDEAMTEYRALIKEGYAPWEAEARAFPTHGTRNGNCHNYGRQCEFYDLCNMPGMEEKVLRQYRVKNIEEKE